MIFQSIIQLGLIPEASRRIAVSVSPFIIMIEVILFPLKVLLIAIDLTITLLTFGWIPALSKAFSSEPVRSVPVDSDPSHRVDPEFKGNLIQSPSSSGGTTLYELAVNSVKRYGSRNCMGSRKFLGWKTPTVKEFEKGTVQFLSFSEVGIKAHKFGAALRANGMVSAPPTTDLNHCKIPCRMAIFENTCAEWMIAAIGAFTQGISVVTVYATLGKDAVAEAVKDNSVPIILCNQKDVSSLVEKCRNMSTLKVIVYTKDLVGPNDTISLPAAPRGVTILSFDEFVDSGNTTAYPPSPPSPDSTAVVMYTSGSTGKPKGVIITHRQIVATVAAADHALGIHAGEDVYLAYLPLAHIMELMAEFCLFSMGCALCYADPKSLTTKGAHPEGALELYKPTLMVAVPKIWDVIKKGIEAKVAAGSAVKQYLVQIAFEWRGFCMKMGFDTPLFKALVFKKISAATGGRLRYALSGGGPLNTEVQDFVRVAFGIVFVQGYGLTETNAGLAIQDHINVDMRGGVAGKPIPSVEVKMESTPDVCDRKGNPYLSTDRTDVEGNPIWGRGEICVRGPSISSGYYTMPDQTAEVFKEDGWFLTGDIGQFLSDGSIQIVDRKKNLVKLKGGEYVALEKMEMIYGNSNFVDAVNGGICCVGDGEMDRPVALIQLNEGYVMKWAKDNGISGDFAKIKDSEELYKAVMDDMKTQHAKSDLSHLEKLVAVSMLTKPWTPENGCLTAANKLQRRAVAEQFETELNTVKKKGIF